MGGSGRALGASFEVGRGIQQAEDALAAGDGALDVRPQQRDLLNGLVEALHVLHEGEDRAQRDDRAEERLIAEDGDPADHHHNRQADEAERLQGGRERAGEASRPYVGVAVGGVDAHELGDVLFLAAEGLHLAHAADALLQVGVDVAHLLAAAPKGFARLIAEVQSRPEHQRQHREAQQGVDEVGLEHLEGDPDHQQRAADHADQGEVDGLLDGLKVAGQAAHDVADLVLGVVAQREPMHVLEDLAAQVVQHVQTRPVSSGRRPCRSWRRRR